MIPDFWKGKRVLITGHTGFKGGWLALWLQSMGAEVHGYSLDPPSTNNLFTIAKVAQGMSTNVNADIRNTNSLNHAIENTQPEIVIHAAAQALVRYSYEHPLDTYSINVMGTANLFEAIRKSSTVQAVVNVTSDKCYENYEQDKGYVESDALGGHDPYSSSKSAVEILTSAWRQSYFNQTTTSVATARAGNVIGGGDWGTDRLIPDIFRTFDAEETLVLRSPEAIRPWQHVLEPLSGYLTLAEHLYTRGHQYAQAWNFGPSREGSRTVSQIVESISKNYQSTNWKREEETQPHETSQLNLNSDKARAKLGWRSRWNLETALTKTTDWHFAWRNEEDMRAKCLQQIDEYIASDHLR